jgi:rfaE bifunctional protein nucleotidyltransferase chain/domain
MNPELLKFKESAQNKKVVFTNGCFDILHRGHLTYLKEAKSCGDLLVVGLNSDRSVKELKGPERPINNEQDRKFMLENLRSVDLVVIFDEQTPLNLIKGLMPNVLVKGGDWAVNQIVGSEDVLNSGGEVLSLNFVDGFSTTNIIEKIKK